MTTAPALSAVLADVALRAADGHAGGRHPVAGALRALDRLAATAADDDLRAWAARIAVPDGALPLPGTGLRAAPYPGLLWSGERCARAGLDGDAQLVLVGLVVGAEHGRSAADLSRAVHAGLAVAAALGERTAASRPVALPTTAVVPAAACAAVLAGVAHDDLRAVLDLAGSLMAIAAPDAGPVPWAGHACAAGWLALRAWAGGLAGMPDGLAHTLTTVAGPVRDDGPAGEVPVAALLERLR